MSISRFNLAPPAADLESLYTFLNANKSGTFLDDVTIELSEDKSTLTISIANATFTIKTGAVLSGVAFATFSGSTTSTLQGKVGGMSTISMKGALLCNNGLIIEPNVNFNGNHYSPEIAITVDNTGKLGVIFKNDSGVVPGSDNVTIAGYRVTVADSSSEATVSLTPQYGAQKTCLAPIVPMCNDNSILLPYAYAALHTQASDVGLQSMTMGGKNYITNGCWYIQD